MGTRSLVIRSWGEKTTSAYVHYDGYPDNMLPQLAHLRPSDIMKKGAWASLDYTNCLDPSPYSTKERKIPGVGIAIEDGTEVSRSSVHTLDDEITQTFRDTWIEFIYVLTGKDTVEVHDGNTVEIHSLRDLRAKFAADKS